MLGAYKGCRCRSVQPSVIDDQWSFDFIKVNVERVAVNNKHSLVLCAYIYLIDPCGYNCPANWTWNACFCYRNMETVANYFDGQAICQAYNATLPIFYTKDQWTSFDKFRAAENVQQGFWLGLDDLQTENRFLWMDGTALAFGSRYFVYPWEYRGPDDLDRTGCTTCADCVRADPAFNYLWQDDSCGLNPGYLTICQTKAARDL